MNRVMMAGCRSGPQVIECLPWFFLSAAGAWILSFALVFFFFSRINHFDFSILLLLLFYCYPIDTPISFDLFETLG